MASSKQDLASLPRSDPRREHLTDLENSAGLLAEVRMNLGLARQRGLAKKVTPLLRAVRAVIRRQRARGLLPDVEEGFTRSGEQVFPTPRR